jgi:flagellar motility protein MotE (MotC chaperone)
MIRAVQDVRLLPVVLLAAASLLALKSFGLLLDGGYILDAPPSAEEARPLTAASNEGDIVGSIPDAAESEPTALNAPAVTGPLIRAAPPDSGTALRQSWAQQMFNYPDVTGSVGGDKNDAISVPSDTPAIRHQSIPARRVRQAANSDAVNPAAMPEQRVLSPSELAILERLQERRKQLDARARELDMRESLLQAAEKRLQGRVHEIKQAQGEIKLAGDKNDDVVETRFKGLIAMYENMKAKDAARIFDRLDLKILADVASRINPRRMSDILANMSPEAAERLTVEFASRGAAHKSPTAAELPKIEGRPTVGQ